MNIQDFDVNDSTQVLNFIQKAAKIGTWHVNLENNEVSWSKLTKQIHDVSEDYSVNIDAAIGYYKEGFSRDKITYCFNCCITEKKPFDVELEIVSAKGREKWVRAIGFPVVENENCIKVQGLFQDITEKNKTLQKLALKEEQFRKTFESTAIGMAIVSLDGRWLKVNKSLKNMLGYTNDEFTSRTFKDLTHKDDLELGQKELKQLLQKEVSSFKIEKRYIHKNNDVIWVSLSVSLVSNDDGIPLHLVAQINDITQRKQSERKVKSLLDITKDQNSRLLNFAHIVSHNLRSHSGNLEMLLDLMKFEEPEATDNSYFPLINTAVDHLSETVENLNQVAIINTKIHEDLTPINLHDVVNKTANSVNASIIENNAKINNLVNPNQIIHTIPAYLDSILLNFLTNSLKYRKENADPIITFKADTSKDSDNNPILILDIEDNGVGIDLDKHGKKLFGMYKTFHKHKDSRGLGLFITKNQIEAIGGKVFVKSKVGIGTIFSLHLRYEKS
ncbi:PAS domain S-box protein [Corallibacter sp.]|uniref:sensor histidine kinase n=1 Tax=Corallibacter sp. TaxID=2038084 RepID=UPI003AB3C8A4